jgi:hypothetical protein
VHEARFAEHVGASNPGASSTIKSSGGGPTNYSLEGCILLISHHVFLILVYSKIKKDRQTIHLFCLKGIPQFRKQGVCHTVCGLASHLHEKVILRQKKNLWKLKYFTMQKKKQIFKKLLQKETKILQDIITL